MNQFISKHAISTGASMENRKLKADPHFTPPRQESGDEFYSNGIFVFNITKMLAYIQANPDRFPAESVSVEELRESNRDILKKTTIKKADPSRPIILAEIAPGRFNVIDGNHRVEKARQMGLAMIPCHRIMAKEHIAFINSEKSYLIYIDYWNEKPREASVE